MANGPPQAALGRTFAALHLWCDLFDRVFPAGGPGVSSTPLCSFKLDS